jgi:hypothetical protein
MMDRFIYQKVSLAPGKDFSKIKKRESFLLSSQGSMRSRWRGGVVRDGFWEEGDAIADRG